MSDNKKRKKSKGDKRAKKKRKTSKKKSMPVPKENAGLPVPQTTTVGPQPTFSLFDICAERTSTLAKATNAMLKVSEDVDDSVREEIKQIRKMRSVTKNYYVNGIEGIVKDRMTLADMNDRRKRFDPNAQVYAGNVQYPRVYYSVLIINIKKAIADLQTTKKDSTIEETMDGHAYINVAQVDCTGKNNTVVKNPLENKLIEVGKEIFFSMKQADATSRIGEWVTIDSFYCMNNKNKPQKFGFRANTIGPVNTKNLGMNVIDYLFTQVIDIAVGNDEKHMLPVPPEIIDPLTGKKEKWIPPTYFMASPSAFKACDISTSLHANTFFNISCLTGAPPQPGQQSVERKKKFDVMMETYEQEELNKFSFRRIKSQASAYSSSVDGSTDYCTLKLFGIENRRKYSLFLEKSVIPGSKNPNNLPPLVMITSVNGKKTRTSGMWKNEVLPFTQCTSGEEVKRLLPSHYLNQTIVGIIPLIYYHLRENKMGIPLKQDDAMLLVLKRLKHGLVPPSDNTVYEFSQTVLENVVNKNQKLVVKGCKNYLNSLFNPFSKNANDIVNLSEYNGDLSGFFKDVAAGKAKFFAWAVGQTVSTEKILLMCKVDHDKESYDQLMVRQLITKDPTGYFEVDSICDLWVIYNK